MSLPLCVRSPCLSCRALALALLVCLLAAPVRLFAQEIELNGKPVRGTSDWSEGLIAEGCRKSASFLHLVERLRKTMLVVYVEPVHDLPGLMRGATTFLGRAGAYRYLRVSIGTAVTRKRQIALIAHELQHATEIAQAPEVVDDASLASLYQRIGDRNRDGFDTSAARDMGDRVWTELWGESKAAVIGAAAEEPETSTAAPPAELSESRALSRSKVKFPPCR